jgi:hypothetical protein
MSCSQNGDAVTLKLDAQQGSFKPWFTNLDVVVYGAPHAATSTAVTGGAKASAQFDSQQHTVKLTAPYVSTGETITINY